MSLNRFEWLKVVLQSDVQDRAKAVASALALKFANDETGRINPHQETIAEYLHDSRDKVKRAIRDLQHAGLLVVVSSPGRGRSNRYRLVTPGGMVSFTRSEKGAEVHHEKEAQVHPYQDIKGAQVHEKGGTGAPSYIEQSSEQKAPAPSECPVDRCVVVAEVSHREAEWNDWLAEKGWPLLSELGMRYSDRSGVGWRMPFPLPPREGDEIEERITDKFLYWACSRMSERKSA